MALKNAQHDVIMRAYEEKQLHNRDRQIRRYEDVYTKIPRLKELDNALSSLSLQHAKKLLNGDEDALPSLKKELSALVAQKQQLLKDHGFPADYLELVYECSNCKDTGYINGQKCHCFKKAAITLLYAQSNLRDVLKTENFQAFQLNYYSNNHIDQKTGRSSLATATEALQVCQKFVQTFSESFQNLFLYGNTGVGKTFLANCIAKELIDTAYSVVYFTSFELFDIFAKSKFEKDQTASAMYEHIFDCDLLIIDDLGTELANSFTTSQLFSCLNERLLSRKSTIISTNLSLDSLVDLYSERTFSRITSNYTMLRLTGDDIRIKKKLMIREEN